MAQLSNAAISSAARDEYPTAPLEVFPLGRGRPDFDQRRMRIMRDIWLLVVSLGWLALLASTALYVLIDIQYVV